MAINSRAGLKVMAKKFLGRNLNFLAITFEPAVRLIQNFEFGKTCMFPGLFAKLVSFWMDCEKFHLLTSIKEMKEKFTAIEILYLKVLLNLG